MARNTVKPAANEDLSNDLINEAAGLDPKTGNPGSDTQTEATVNEPPEGTANDPAPGNLEPLNQPDPAADIQPEPGASLPAPNAIPLSEEQIEAGLAAMDPESRKALEDHFANKNAGSEGTAKTDLPVANINQPEGSREAPLYVGDAKDADAATLHQERETKYGPDYVVASRGKDQQTVFTALAWNLMRGDKGGWKQQVQVPSEIRELRNSKK